MDLEVSLANEAGEVKVLGSASAAVPAGERERPEGAGRSTAP